ncbi:MAG: SDR family NAD(P)-dependent oxidoreductase [Candidatus Izemoplasmatales bacterium]|jgi:hypothetical protein|nr:SDR family NAD(P)-dependent oxidoreductase [Candidatus Izemoplasmatales bacterium]MDD3865205.1 SDR family NAD(P)-dependent oxidoreductase [Candidatus Izemoplasmatales bacterium]
MNVFITGAAGGLGRAMAVECAKRGYNIVLTDCDEIHLVQIKNGLLRQYDINIEIIVCDLTNKEDVDTLIKKIDFLNLKFDMMLNIAGIDNEGAFMSRKYDQIGDIVKVNVEATLHITYEILNRRNTPFNIVFVSSLASQFPMPLKATYAASKRFLFDFALSLGVELKESKVSVLTLCPGGLATNPTVIEAIDAQGFFGKATTNRLEIVSRKTIQKALRGDTVYFPGVLNNLFRIFNNLLPRQMVANLIHRRWVKSQAKWLNTNNQSMANMVKTPITQNLETKGVI